MHHLYLTRLNYLAVVAASLAAFFIGAIWYTVLFGKLWAVKHGYTPEQLKEMQAKRPMPVFFAELIFCYFIAAVGIDILLVDIPNVELVTGVHVGLICWSIVAAFRMTAHVSSAKLIGAYLIDAGFDLVALPVMGAILAAWR
jgi:Ca2+/Na+ antiporter